MTFQEWFQSKQGEPYDSMFMFAKDAWEAATAQVMAENDAVIAIQRKEIERLRIRINILTTG